MDLLEILATHVLHHLAHANGGSANATAWILETTSLTM